MGRCGGCAPGYNLDRQYYVCTLQWNLPVGSSCAADASCTSLRCEGSVCCLPGTLPGCNMCGSQGQCTGCASGYSLVNGFCIPGGTGGSGSGSGSGSGTGGGLLPVGAFCRVDVDCTGLLCRGTCCADDVDVNCGLCNSTGSCLGCASPFMLRDTVCVAPPAAVCAQLAVNLG